MSGQQASWRTVKGNVYIHCEVTMLHYSIILGIQK